MQQSPIVLVGRILLSIIFILAGFGKITALGGTAGYFGSMGLPMPMVTAVVVALVELLGGIAILVGFQPFRAVMLYLKSQYRTVMDGFLDGVCM